MLLRFWTKGRHLNSGVLFFAASLLAALFNYFFQVVASQQLSPKEYAELNAWVANLAPFLVGAALMQYQSNFRPAKPATLRVAIVALGFLGIAFVCTWQMSSEPFGFLHSVYVVSATAMVSWLLGQAQIRLRFVLLAAGSFIVAFGRFAVGAWNFPGFFSLDKFAVANLFGAVAATLLVGVSLWNAEKVKGTDRDDFWHSAVILSVAGAIVPLFDMFLMNHTQAEADFIQFARASLFGRAVYALTAIFAQWLLPNQIRGEKFGVTISLRKVMAGAVVVCAAAGWVSPYVAQYIFRWDSAPDEWLVFLASAEVSMLAIVFFMVQTLCAQHKPRQAGLFLLLLGVEAGLQLLFKFPMMYYLSGALVVQAVSVLVFLQAAPKRSARK